MKYVVALMLVCTIIVPPTAFAQESAPVTAGVDAAAIPLVPVVDVQTETAPTDAVVNADTPAVPESVTVSPETITTDETMPGPTAAPATEQTDPTIVQDTAPTQESAPADVLENTVDPAAATTTESEVITVLEASTTPSDIPVVSEASTTPLVATDTPPVDTVDTIESSIEVVPEEIPLLPSDGLDIVAETLAPRVETVEKNIVEKKDEDPKYLIALSGKTIPAKKEGIVGVSSLTAPAATTIDSTTGTMTVSGSCASPYFVVLIFKNQNDYEIDPRSFIMNKAFPCENGAYSYSIDRLPPTLPNGTYYLLIGEQGERGSWSPITALTEVSINRSN